MLGAAADGAGLPPGQERAVGCRLEAKLPGSPMATQAPTQPSDPELEPTAWDLEPLVEGQGPDGVDAG